MANSSEMSHEGRAADPLEKLVQPVSDLGEARVDARFVLVAARRPTHADAADRFVAPYLLASRRAHKS